MADSSAFTGEGDNTEYRIHRRPDLQVVTKGARIHYACDWNGAGNRPRVIGPHHDGPRDGIRWYSYGSGRPKGWYQNQVKTGPLQDHWDLTWDDQPGQYVVIAEIRNGSAPDRAPTYRYRSQQIGDAAAMLGDWLDRLLAHGDGPSPDDAEREIARYRTLLDDVANRFPPPDAAAHQQVVDNWAQLARRLRELLAPSDGKRRIPVRAVHVETETQAQRPLLLFLTELDDVTRPVGRGGAVKRKRWSLVDWTDASDPRFRGHADGEGDTPKQAIESCFSNWDWGNRYPAGHVRFEVPRSLRPIIGGDVQRQMRTNGTNLTEEVVAVFQWIAIGTTLIAGFCFIFVAVPTLTSVAMGTSMLASTAGAVFSVAHRWREGLFDWQADAIDGLTIVGNLLGAGAWARGARVRLPGQGASTRDFLFVGARIGTDAVQGVLIAASRIDDLDALMEDPSLPPEERARKTLALLAELTAVGLMTAVSIKASAKEAESLSRRPRHLQKDDPRANVPDDVLENLTRRDGPIIDTTAPRIVEGNTAKTPQLKAKLQTGRRPAPVSAPLEAHETDFAKAFTEDQHPWRTYKIDKNEIDLVDVDGFVFQAECNKGTLKITIYTVFDPVLDPERITYFESTVFKKSTAMKARDLFPLMYKHFEQTGNPVVRLKGTWAWKNYKMAKDVFDPLVKSGMPESQAAKIAVKAASTYTDYHAPRGFTRVTAAKHLANAKLFSFTIEKE